jgi:uncharacterized membrane protein YfcA
MACRKKNGVLVYLLALLVGAQIAHLIPARQLEIIIGLFALLTAAQMFSGWRG